MKGILFTPDNIKATQDGLKTQTRRVITLPKWLKSYEPRLDELWTDRGELGDYIHIPCYKYPIDDEIWGNFKTVQRHYPRYSVGEIVYIKEAWTVNSGRLISYKSDYKNNPYVISKVKWNSPLFLKAKDARTFILIKDVRAERLQDITEEDAKAEGINNTFRDGDTKTFNVELKSENNYQANIPISMFRDLWDSINAKKGYPWSSNCWVWVYSYELAENK